MIVQDRRCDRGTHTGCSGCDSYTAAKHIHAGIQIADQSDRIAGVDPGVLAGRRPDRRILNDHGDRACYGIALGGSCCQTDDHIGVVSVRLDQDIALISLNDDFVTGI